MKLVGISIYNMHIPFKKGYAHDADRWQYGDSVVVRVCSEDGSVGYGECKPKKNLTGETVSNVTEYIADILWPSIEMQSLPIEDNPQLGYKAFEGIQSLLPDFPVPDVLTWNSARAAVELAIIDCFLRAKGRSIVEYIQPKQTALEYSATITARDPVKIASLAKEYYEAGRSCLRLKINDDYKSQIEALYDVVDKDKISLHLDANGCFDLTAAIKACNEIYANYPVEAIEDPIPRGDIRDLKVLSQETSMPLMLDDWIISQSDADAVIENIDKGILYLKVSKNGGLISTLAIAEKAMKAGFSIGVGSHIGETGLLSAVGRNVAAYLGSCKYVAGSASSSRLVQDIVQEEVSIDGNGYGAPFLGLGLGVSTSDVYLEKFSAQKLYLGQDVSPSSIHSDQAEYDRAF